MADKESLLHLSTEVDKYENLLKDAKSRYEEQYKKEVLDLIKLSGYEKHEINRPETHCPIDNKWDMFYKDGPKGLVYKKYWDEKLANEVREKVKTTVGENDMMNDYNNLKSTFQKEVIDVIMHSNTPQYTYESFLRTASLRDEIKGDGRGTYIDGQLHYLARLANFYDDKKMINIIEYLLMACLVYKHRDGSNSDNFISSVDNMFIILGYTREKAQAVMYPLYGSITKEEQSRMKRAEYGVKNFIELVSSK